MKSFLVSFLLKWFWSFLLVFPFLAYSGSSEFSPQAIFIQIFNFSIFLFAFLFLIRKPLQTLFHKRQKDFFSFAEQALKLEKAKKAEKKLWDKKLSDLNEKEKTIQQEAQEEGERFITQKKQELKKLSRSLKMASEFLLNLEKEKLKRESLSHWKKQLVDGVRRDLKESARSKDFQKKEQKTFLQLLQKKKLREKIAFSK